MDLSLPISYNGLTASGISAATAGAPQAGIVFESVDPSGVDVRQYTDNRATQDGLDAADAYLGGRTIQIFAAVYGSTLGDMWDRHALLIKAFNPVIAISNDSANFGFRPLKFFRPTADISTWPFSAYPSGIPLQIYCRPTTIGRYTVNRANTGGTASKGGVLRQQIGLMARDPRIYLQSAITAALTTATTSASHRGTHPTFPILTFAITSSGHSSTRFFLDSGSMHLNLAAISTGSYTVDYSQRTIVDNTGARRDELFNAALTQNFAQVTPGGSAIFVQNGGALSNPIFTYTEAWL